MNPLTKLVLKELRKVADKIESGNCELTEEEAMNILKVVANEAMSKDQACSYHNIRRSKFDELVNQGRLPRGRKVRGFNELRWYKSELVVTDLSPN